jgi:23S rRNA (uridine2552-2'-O)-methyltransferase
MPSPSARTSARIMYNRRDHYHRKAKKAGYRSRAAYKLKGINNRFHLLSRGDSVLDLGAAPGGWLQVAREIVGEEGYVLGVDKERISPLQYENVAVLQSDVDDLQLERTFDVILSDMAPHTIGKRDVDQYRSYMLARKTFQTAEKMLKENGNFLTKIFQSEHVTSFSRELEKKFTYVKQYRPRATRRGSFEMYIVCKKFRKTD